MLLFELFDSGDSMLNRLRQAAVEVLAPIIGQDVPFVTMNQMIDSLRNLNTGIRIDRAMIMKILNPQIIKAISKIDGDHIYLNDSNGPEVENSEKEEQKQKEDVYNNAKQQAKKEVDKD